MLSRVLFFFGVGFILLAVTGFVIVEMRYSPRQIGSTTIPGEELIPPTITFTPTTTFTPTLTPTPTFTPTITPTLTLTSTPTTTFTPTLTPTASPLPQSTNCFKYHTVKQGEYLVKIGRIYNVSWRYLADINRLANPSKIFPGQVLCVAVEDGAPAPPHPLPPPPPTPAPPPGYSGFPTFSIVSVVMDDQVTVQTYNLTPNDVYTVTMGRMGTRGIGGIVVKKVETGSGGAKQLTFDIPSALHGSYKISIRMESPTSHYFAYNWFYNNVTGTGVKPTDGVSQTPTYTSLPTKIGTGPLPTPFISPTVSPTLSATTTPTPLPTLLVESEWPERMEKGCSDTIRISLIRTRDELYVVTVEETRHTAEIATPKLIGGTLEAPIEELYGPEYEACAKANLEGGAFEEELITPIIAGQECRPLNQYEIEWEWSIEHKKENEEDNPLLGAAIIIHWKPITSGGEPIQQQIWDGKFKIKISSPFIKTIRLKAINYLNIFVGSLLSAPWLYSRFRELVEKRRKKEEDEPLILLP